MTCLTDLLYHLWLDVVKGLKETLLESSIDGLCHGDQVPPHDDLVISQLSDRPLGSIKLAPQIVYHCLELLLLLCRNGR